MLMSAPSIRRSAAVLPTVCLLTLQHTALPSSAAAAATHRASVRGAGLGGTGVDVATVLIGLIGLALIIAGGASIVVQRRRTRSLPGAKLAHSSAEPHRPGD